MQGTIVADAPPASDAPAAAVRQRCADGAAAVAAAALPAAEASWPEGYVVVLTAAGEATHLEMLRARDTSKTRPRHATTRPRHVQDTSKTRP